MSFILHHLSPTPFRFLGELPLITEIPFDLIFKNAITCTQLPFPLVSQHLHFSVLHIINEPAFENLAIHLLQMRKPLYGGSPSGYRQKCCVALSPVYHDPHFCLSHTHTHTDKHTHTFYFRGIISPVPQGIFVDIVGRFHDNRCI